MAPKDIWVLFLEPLNAAPYGKRDFAEVIKLRILRWGDYLESAR